jgi:hypothetical protein
LRKNYNSLPLLYKLFGIENSVVVLKLLCLAMILVLSNIQSQFLNYRHKADMLKEELEDWDRRSFIEPQNRLGSKVLWHNAQIYTMYILYTVLPITQLSLLGLYSFIYRSVLGALFLTSTLILLYTQQTEFWRKSYKVIGILMMLSMLVIYALQFAFFDERVEVDLLSWFGVKKTASKPISGQVVPLFLLLALCALQKASLKVESLLYSRQDPYQSILDRIEYDQGKSSGCYDVLEEEKEQNNEEIKIEDEKSGSSGDTQEKQI